MIMMVDLKYKSVVWVVLIPSPYGNDCRSKIQIQVLCKSYMQMHFCKSIHISLTVNELASEQFTVSNLAESIYY